MDDKFKDEMTIVIPAFNEDATIGEVIEQAREHCKDFLKEIIVVDDGSTDNTSAVAEKAGARVISHKQNRGYGASLKTGIRAAQTEFILNMDADGQHRAADVVRLWEQSKDFDMVVGNRIKLLHSPIARMPGKWVLRIMANYLTRRSIPDLNSGLRLIRKSIAVKYLHLCPAGFSFSTTMTMVMLNRGYVVHYVPIEVDKRTGGSTVSLLTGLEAIILILRIATLFSPLRVFLPVSVLFGTFGFLWALPIFWAGEGVSTGALLILLTAVILFMLGLLSDQISQMRLERFE